MTLFRRRTLATITPEQRLFVLALEPEHKESYWRRLFKPFGGNSMVIKFSHLYEKMPPDYRVSRLMDVELVNLEDLDPEFLERDTAIQGGGHYPLPKTGKYMILWLESTIMNIRWQTIRRWTPEKERYYRGFIGKEVDCVVPNDPPSHRG